MILNAGKANARAVKVEAESATEAYDGESALVAVQHTPDGVVGGKVSARHARSMLATGMIHRLHTCVGTRRT